MKIIIANGGYRGELGAELILKESICINGKRFRRRQIIELVKKQKNRPKVIDYQV